MGWFGCPAGSMTGPAGSSGTLSEAGSPLSGAELLDWLSGSLAGEESYCGGVQPASRSMASSAARICFIEVASFLIFFCVHKNSAVCVGFYSTGLSPSGKRWSFQYHQRSLDGSGEGVMA